MQRHSDLATWLILLLLAPIRSLCLVINSDRWQPYQHQPEHGQLPIAKHRLGKISVEHAYAICHMPCGDKVKFTLLLT